MQGTAASSVDGGLLVGADIYKRFGALTVLDGVNFKLAANEAVGIVGPNGAGKTTLLSVLAGAYPPSGGAVYFNGADVTSSTPRNVAGWALLARIKFHARLAAYCFRELHCRRDDRRRPFGPRSLPNLR